VGQAVGEGTRWIWPGGMVCGENAIGAGKWQVACFSCLLGVGWAWLEGMETKERNHGPQPLDAVMTEAGLDNHALVAVSGEHLTHKEVAKGRKGRWLTPNLRGKICRAMDRALPRESPWRANELFSYVADRSVGE